MMHAFRYRLPLTQPITIGRTTLRHREGLLLRQANRWAEAAPLPGLSEETLEDVLAASDQHEPAALPSLAFAKDSLRQPWSPYAVSVNALLQGTPEQILTKARQLADSSCRAVKLKVGRTANVQDDVNLVQAVSQRLRPEQRIRLDANRAWDFQQAVSFAEQFAGTHIEYLEEPLRDPSRLEEFFDRTSIPYALDETLSEGHCLTLFPRAATLVVKPTILGGRQRIETLAATGRPLVFSSCFETGVGIAHIAQLAAEFAADSPAGLDTYAWLAQDVCEPPLSMERWQLRVDELPCVREDRLEELTR